MSLDFQSGCLWVRTMMLLYRSLCKQFTLAMFLENNSNNTVFLCLAIRNKHTSFDAMLIWMKFAKDGKLHIQFQHSTERTTIISRVIFRMSQTKSRLPPQAKDCGLRDVYSYLSIKIPRPTCRSHTKASQSHKSAFSSRTKNFASLVNVMLTNCSF